MKNHKTILILIAMSILLPAQHLSAQPSGWNFTLGTGVYGENVYLGSDDYYVAPFPNVEVSYTHENVGYSLSLLDGVSVTYTSPEMGFLVCFNIHPGETRNSEKYSIFGADVAHSTKTRTLLEGTPDLDTPLAFSTMLSFPTPIGLFGLSAAYHPTAIKYKQSEQEKDRKDGFIYSVLYMIHGSVTDRLSIAGQVGVDFMDRNYAETWYSIKQPTESLPFFNAGAGWRSSMICVEAHYQLSERIEIAATGTSTLLLEDAKRSPFTVEKTQRSMIVETVYRF